MTPDISQVRIGQQLTNGGFGAAAVGTLEVAVFDDGDRRVCGAADVITIRVDGCRQVDDLLDITEQGPGPAQLRQPRGDSEYRPRRERRDERGRQDAELRLGKLATAEREC